ncbi:uncharacterized protein M437DRAFT_68959 [Aureobasidium melanogenum CBS 110374]|uniref:Uncharacterized protein n=1 Tax=Aureobasidium melanogenum (strain CBS 110374) TaxID=1043003 RepID=A0A074VKN0_AURM1|nr:uncharacterized protein M437DRAFT_68959 [Aureobasidium melanogenum CBS 110374]KEQ59634.1 hypothetical protein M437DRAFT_68959 [Aureobasidium melanogenum CBS 110374]
MTRTVLPRSLCDWDFIDVRSFLNYQRTAAKVNQSSFAAMLKLEKERRSRSEVLGSACFPHPQSREEDEGEKFWSSWQEKYWLMHLPKHFSCFSETDQRFGMSSDAFIRTQLLEKVGVFVHVRRSSFWLQNASWCSGGTRKAKRRNYDASRPRATYAKDKAKIFERVSKVLKEESLGVKGC